jgi:hypothetical protein
VQTTCKRFSELRPARLSTRSAVPNDAVVEVQANGICPFRIPEEDFMKCDLPPVAVGHGSQTNMGGDCQHECDYARDTGDQRI